MIGLAGGGSFGETAGESRRRRPDIDLAVAAAGVNRLPACN